MILRIQKSKSFRLTSLTLALCLFIDLVLPRQAFALTGGAAQPEFNSFTPVGTSDMVDLSSGDMNYNIPLMDVGGYPLNLAYSSGVSMDEEASHVGLGWNLAVGQISRNVRGIPDDFNGDEMVYENYLKPNVTVGLNFAFQPGAVGVEWDKEGGSLTVPEQDTGSAPGIKASISVKYNNYTGISVSPGLGITKEYKKDVSVGFNANSGPDGLVVSPSVSLHNTSEKNDQRDKDLGLNFGLSMNSRQGLSALTLGMSRKAQYKENTGSKKIKNSGFNVGSTISFTDPVYTPTKRVGMETANFTLNAEPGGIELFGAEGAAEITAYGTVTKVREEEENKSVSAYGYAHTEEAGKHAILDFNREKDGSFSVNATNLPITNYTYDIYSVKGQGVSGTYRPYRNQVGYVYDTYVWDGSFSGTLGLEVGTGNLFKAGVDIEASGVESHSGAWDAITGVQQFLKDAASSTVEYEKVHYKNVGDLSADKEYGLFTQIGEYQPVRVPISGVPFYRGTPNAISVKSSANSQLMTLLGIGAPVQRQKRVNRNQTIHNLTKAQVNQGIGYSPTSYGSQEYLWANGSKDHHTAEVQIIRNDGARYVYGLPVYNTLKKEASFAVDAEKSDCATGLVKYNQSDVNAPKNLPNDKYLSRTTTPAYVHTHLLTSILSTDYQDVDIVPGPSQGDLGSYTKFSYTKKESNYKWRVPFEAGQANHNEGLKTDPKDDRGNYVYGEKELYYIDRIETKTHLAIFEYSERQDARGVLGESGGMSSSSAHMYKLDKISLYAVGEYYDENGAVVPGATPIKEVFFKYSYSLCPGVPNNNGIVTNELSNHGGKLTLKKVYFQYRNSAMGKYTGYHFNYGEYQPITNASGDVIHPDEYSNPGIQASELNTTYIPAPAPLNPINQTDAEIAALNLAANTTGLNPRYNIKGYDSWGNYKPTSDECYNLSLLTAAEFPYVEQTDEYVQKNRSAVWNLRRIDLPSGGNIEIEYESDDYAFVQDKEVMRMYKVYGAGRTAIPTGAEVPSGNREAVELFGNPVLNNANEYLYVEVDEDATLLSTTEIKDRYLKGIYGGPPIYFRFLVNMTQVGGVSSGNSPAKFDYVTGYLEHEESGTQLAAFNAGGKHFISIPVQLQEKEGGWLNAFVNLTNKVHPVSKAAWNFGKKYLTKFVYSNQPNGDTDDIEQIVTDLLTPEVISNLIEIYTGPNARLENNNIGRQFIAGKSWLRLSTGDTQKYGGGCRVKEIRMSDVWEEMNSNQSNYQTMRYGQKYDYTLADGESTSGVATYEPVGNKENPFVQPEFTSIEKLVAPDEENFVEMPYGECFFPSPQVTYSRVSVSNVDAGTNTIASTQVKRRNKTGRVVTEFYTSKDFPTIVDQTAVDPYEDKTPWLFNLLKVVDRNHLTMTQGYVVHLNDMNGKQKSQRVYAEGQSSPISGVDYNYRTHTGNSNYTASENPDGNKGKLNNKVRVIDADGKVSFKTIGVETDLVFDYRENATKSVVAGMNTNLATFVFGVVPLPVPMLLPAVTLNEDQFRSVTATKVIQTFGLLEETVAYDAGAAVYTRNLAWDAETGEVLVTETVDEYNEKYYTMNYPAHWFYDGMGQASKNIALDGELSANGSGYTMTGVSQASNYFVPGDELLLSFSGQSNRKAWVTHVQGNAIRLIDENGTDITGGSGDFVLTRSGRRNLQSAGIMNVTLMHNPLTDLSGNYVSNLGTDFLLTGSSYQTNWADWRIINAGAVDYSQNWKLPCECGFDVTSSAADYNKYRYNERGVWRTKSSRTYLTGRNSESEVTPRREGFFTGFQPMYKLSNNGNWYKDFSEWTFVSEVSQYSPYGFELENRDALNRYSAAQYGYNNTFPMAVGANTEYREIGFDGFEDYVGFDGCPNAHFSFQESTSPSAHVSTEQSHTGKYSLKVLGNSSSILTKILDCITAQP